MNKKQRWIGSILGAGLALGLLLPAGAQTTEREKGSDTQKPVVNSYDKRPDPRGQNQSIDSAQYEDELDKTENVPTYNKTPDPSGKNQDLDSERYRQDNSLNSDEGKDGNEVSQTVEPEPARGDGQKPVVRTYENVPEAQSNTVRTRANDVSNVEEPALGDDQKPVVPTYDKRPDPKGDAQKLDAVRYEQENDANNGRPAELQMKVLEGSVEE